jgi:hypothetical protein
MSVAVDACTCTKYMSRCPLETSCGTCNSYGLNDHTKPCLTELVTFENSDTCSNGSFSDNFYNSDGKDCNCVPLILQKNKFKEALATILTKKIVCVQQCTYFLFSVNLLLVGVNYGQRTMQVCS